MVILLLRVQRYVNDIKKIIEKTEIYGRELGIVGKYLKINIKNNIRNYLDMVQDRKEFSQEELIIIMKEFEQYLDVSILDEYYERVDSLLNMTSESSELSVENTHEDNLT